MPDTPSWQQHLKRIGHLLLNRAYRGTGPKWSKTVPRRSFADHFKDPIELVQDGIDDGTLGEEVPAYCIPGDEVEKLEQLCRDALQAFEHAGMIPPLEPPEDESDPKPGHEAYHLVYSLLAACADRLSSIYRGEPADLPLSPPEYLDCFQRAVESQQEVDATSRTTLAQKGKSGPILTEGQQYVLEVLDGRTLTAKQIVTAIGKDHNHTTSDDTVRQHVRDLNKAGYQIKNRPGRGYYRPDAPPPNAKRS